MKFVKENLTLVICAAVALIFVGMLFWPLGSMISTFQDSMKSRMTDQATAISYSKTKLEIPGTEPITGVPSEKLIIFKKQLIDSVNQGAVKVEDAAASLNAQGRVSNGFPLLNNEEIKGFVPVLTSEPQDFKARYGALFRTWTALLVGKANVPATPPDSNLLKTDYDAMMAAQLATLPPGAAMGGGMAGQQDPKQFLEYEKRKIYARAADIQIYVDPSPNGGSFQVRPWLLADDPPSEQQIYEALVDSWLQGDVVRAISQVNKAVLDKQSPENKNVSHAPIKRLIHVMVGTNAINRRLSSSAGMGGMQSTAIEDPGSQFFTGQVGNMAAPVAAAAPVAGGPPVTNYDFDMTGRSSGSVYDVVLMSVHMDLDPAYKQAFFDQLYRQNVGYTVLNVQERTVDPLDRVSFGYIYGETQTVEVDVLVEALLLRKWTSPLMPAALKTQLSVPAAAGAAGGTPAATPAATPSAILRGN